MILVVLLLGVLPGLLASASPAQPGQWKTVKSKTQQFTLQVPDNWRFATAGSESIYEWARVQGGKLSRVTIDGSQAKGAMGDITAAAERVETGTLEMLADQMGLGGEGAYEPDVSERGEGRLHGMLGDLAAKQDKSFKDEGDIKECTFAERPAAYSHYTTRRRVGLLNVKVKGRRITAPAGDLAYDIRAECPEKHWDKFEPIATKILESAEMGGRD